jgi:hypothetical protein
MYVEWVCSRRYGQFLRGKCTLNEFDLFQNSVTTESLFETTLRGTDQNPVKNWARVDSSLPGATASQYLTQTALR